MSERIIGAVVLGLLLLTGCGTGSEPADTSTVAPESTITTTTTETTTRTTTPRTGSPSAPEFAPAPGGDLAPA